MGPGECPPITKATSPRSMSPNRTEPTRAVLEETRLRMTEDILHVGADVDRGPPELIRIDEDDHGKLFNEFAGPRPRGEGVGRRLELRGVVGRLGHPKSLPRAALRAPERDVPSLREDGRADEGDGLENGLRVAFGVRRSPRRGAPGRSAFGPTCGRRRTVLGGRDVARNLTYLRHGVHERRRGAPLRLSRP